MTKKKKVANGYVRYFKKRFKELSKEKPGVEAKEINKMVTQDWKNLSDTQKEKYNKESELEHAKQDISKEER